MSKKEQGKAPVLRFKGFIDDWEQRKLGDIANVYDGTHTTPDYQKNGIMFLSVENIDTLTSKKFITKSDYLENYKHKPEYHDIFMTRIGSIGKTNILETHDPRAFYVSLALIKPKDIDPYYLKYWLSSNTTQKEIWRRTLQIAFPQKINKDEISKVQSSISKSKNEQYNIGQLLNKIDHLLLLQQRKLDELDQLKKGTQQRLIVNNAIPQIRFNKFSGSWVRRKLNEITNYRNGKAHEKVINSNGKYIVINSKFISSNGTIIKHTDKNLSPLQKNDITFVLSDVPNGKALAKTYLVPFNNVYSLNQRIAAIKASNETDPYFLYFLLNRNEYFLRFDDHVGQTNLSKSDILSFTNFYPGLKEQQTIGKLLKITHERIINEKTKIVELRVLKEFLLQKLFI